jgi:hypothetical protein
MPSGFPDTEFRAFGLAGHAFLPKILSDEDLNDPLERLRQFDWAWQAVRYRYRLCFECMTSGIAAFRGTFRPLKNPHP